MSIQEQRLAAFEAWARTACGMPAGTPLNWGAVWTKDSWAAWNAALDSVVIELPPCIDADEVAEHFAIDEEGHDMAVGISQMVNGAIIACGAFIKAAGLKVAP